MTKEHASTDVAAKLDRIEAHLRNLDRRDRVRMIGSTVRSVVSLGMLLFVLWSTWYLFDHLGDVMKYVLQESAKQSQEMMKSGSEGFVKELQQYFKK